VFLGLVYSLGRFRNIHLHGNGKKNGAAKKGKPLCSIPESKASPKTLGFLCGCLAHHLLLLAEGR